METILVQIPAYKDEEIIPSVKDLYAKAKHPDHINVGICWQNRLDGDSGELNIEGPGENVRILNMQASASEGVGWAKRHARSLYQNEDYVLAVDSHSRFAEDWDTTLIESLGQCPSSKAILSSSPHPYRLHGQTLVEETATFRYPSHYAANGFLKLVALRFNTVPQLPLQAPFLSPRFMFSKAQLIQDVPADPFIYFSEEEITFSMRAWCAGWDVYHSTRVPIWHLYNSDPTLRPLHWKENPDWQQYQRRSRDCYDAYLNGANHPFTGARSAYRLQTTRDLKSFQQFAGVDLRRKQIFSDAPEASFNHSLRPFCDDVENLWQQTRTRQSGKKVLPRETPSTGSSTGGSLRSH